MRDTLSLSLSPSPFLLVTAAITKNNFVFSKSHKVKYNTDKESNRDSSRSVSSNTVVANIETHTLALSLQDYPLSTKTEEKVSL